MTRLPRNEPRFSQPVRQILFMLLALIVFAAACVAGSGTLRAIIMSSPLLNGIILAVFLIGVLSCFWQALTLVRAVSWIEGFALDRPGFDVTDPPRLLAPLATLLKERKNRRAIGSSSARSILDSVGTRLDEARDITRYIINLLIFLGLLGTFYGLATSIPAIVDTIRSLGEQGEGGDIFGQLIGGLEDQLGGMGTAFASSLLGLTGSLVVGLLDLFAGHGQNRFYMELEEWLSSITRISFAGGEEEGGGMKEGFAAALEQLGDRVDDLGAAVDDLVMQSARGAAATEDLLGLLKLQAEKEEPAKPETPAEPVIDPAIPLLERIAAAQEQSGTGSDKVAFHRIETQLNQLIEEIDAGRQDSITALRGDLQRLITAIERATEA
ncbi:biopolymer transporter ExbB [Paracoccaceae bacterium GXU_MW_L88]